MDLKATLADQLGHFTPQDIVTALICVLAAAFFGFLFGLIAKPAGGPDARSTAALSAAVAFAVSLVRASVPLAIGLVAVALLIRPSGSSDMRGFLHRLVAVAIGLGCGSSASIVVAALLVPMGLLLRWASAERKA
ncbi:MAG: hypothetical protein U0U25_03455 [Flavobacteriales bacterium]